MVDYRKISAASYRRVAFVGIIIMLIGIGLAIWGTRVLLKARALSQKGIRTEGTVVDVYKNGIYRSPIVEFYTQEGEKMSFRSEFEYNLDSYPYKLGDKVPVIYDPDNPANAKIEAFWERNFLHIFLLFLGILIFLIGIIMRRIYLKKAKEYES